MEIIDSAEPITRAQRIALSIVLEQLKQKQGILKELDTKIVNGITEEEELVQEICDTEEYQTILAEKIAFVHDFLQATVSPLSHLAPHSATNTSTLPTSLSTSSSLPNSVETTENPSEVNTSGTETLPDTNSEAPVSTAVTKMPSGDITLNVSGDTSVRCTHHTNEAFEYATRLPKLNLPYFSGDPLTWQTFWDSFSPAVHNNPKLTGVQKFNYLRAQLRGDATKVIAGFPLTDANYLHSIILLKERFGQPYKLVNAHMQALLGLSSTANTLSSLQSFYDTVENHIRALSSLGKSPESYGDLLTPIIFGRLPREVQKNLARDHDSGEWKINEMRSSIMKEIQILETGIHLSGCHDQSANSDAPAMTTASFYTDTRHHPPQPSSKKPISCIYCKQQHSVWLGSVRIGSKKYQVYTSYRSAI